MAIPLRVGSGKSQLDVVRNSKNPKMRDPRVWLGVVLLLGSMIIAQTMIAKASARVQAVTLVNDIAAGAMIRANDVTTSRVAVPNAETLIGDPNEVVGKVAATNLFSGGLITQTSVAAGFAENVRVVSVPIRAGHLPFIEHGSRVDVWVTPSTDGVALPGPAQLIIPSAVLESAPEVVDPGMDTSVTLQISDDQVQVLVQAMRDGVIDLVAIPGATS